MKNLLPEEIINNKFSRGLQAVDWIQRLKEQWNSIFSEINKMLNDEDARYYFNIEKLKSYFHKYSNVKEQYSNEEKYELRCLFIAYVFYNYLKNNFS